jgi:hypothetical protein
VVHAPVTRWCAWSTRLCFFFSYSSGFSLYFEFGLYFGYVFLYFGFTLYFGFDFHMYFGLWVFFEKGCSGFGGLLSCFRSRFGCLLGASFVCWALGVLGALYGFRVLGLFFVGLFGFFLLWVGFGDFYVYSRCNYTW